MKQKLVSKQTVFLLEVNGSVWFNNLQILNGINQCGDSYNFSKSNLIIWIKTVILNNAYETREDRYWLNSLRHGYLHHKKLHR